LGATSDTLLNLQTVCGNGYKRGRKLLFCLDNFIKNVKELRIVVSCWCCSYVLQTRI
jgi:hypothetical protein